jgi:hypothetical protein
MSQKRPPPYSLKEVSRALESPGFALIAVFAIMLVR